MGFFDDEYEEIDAPQPRRRRKNARNADRLGWQDMVEEVEEDEDEDTIKELEVTERGHSRISRDEEIEPDFWEQENEE